MDIVEVKSEDDFYILIVEESPEDCKDHIERIAKTEQTQGDQVNLIPQCEELELTVKKEPSAEVQITDNQLSNEYSHKIRIQGEMLQHNDPENLFTDTIRCNGYSVCEPGGQAHDGGLTQLPPQKFNYYKRSNVLPRKVRRAIKIPCAVCGKMICNANMKLHLEVHSEIKKFWCPHCPARFRTKRAVQAHLNAHTGTRPYRCDQCPRAYTSDTALRAHKMDHGIKQYKCEYCKQAYSRKHTLKLHLATHSDGREYLCTECGKVFNNRYGLEVHSRQHRTAQNKFSCMDCGKMYAKMTGLNIHMKKKHGHQIITRKMFFNSLPLMVEVSALLVGDDETSDTVDDPGNIGDLEVAVNSDVTDKEKIADFSETTPHLGDNTIGLNNMEAADSLWVNNS